MDNPSLRSKTSASALTTSISSPYRALWSQIPSYEIKFNPTHNMHRFIRIPFYFARKQTTNPYPLFSRVYFGDSRINTRHSIVPILQGDQSLTNIHLAKLTNQGSNNGESHWVFIFYIAHLSQRRWFKSEDQQGNGATWYTRRNNIGHMGILKDVYRKESLKPSLLITKATQAYHRNRRNRT